MTGHGWHHADGPTDPSAKESSPRTLRYAVGALDQLAADARARDRRERPPPRDGHRSSAPPPPTPAAGQPRVSALLPGALAGVRTDGEGEPVFERGMLQLDPEKLIPRADSDAYRITVRDAYLLAGHQLPLEVDGRTLMALRHQGKLDPAPRSPRRDGEDRELAELAHRTGEPVAILRRLPASYHHQWLAAQRQADAARASAEMTAFRQQIADTFHPYRR